MSTVITGLPTTITTPLAATVIDATNASPIVIETSAAHLYATGDRVVITGVTGNTAANSAATTPWVIIVVDATHFSLTGSVGSGAYVAGGTCSNRSLTPQFTIPSDGDTFDAAAFNVAYQALADRTQYLQKRIDNYRTVSNGFAIADVHARGCDDSAAKSADPSTIVSQWAPILDNGDATVDRSKYYTDRQGLRFYNVNAAAATGKHVLVLLNAYLIQGATLTSTLLILKGAAGHAALPAMMPALGVTRYDHVADAWTSLKSGTAMTDDPSASLVAYEASHGITATLDQNNIVDTTTYSYYAIICNEGHTDATAQLRLQQLIVTMTVSTP